MREILFRGKDLNGNWRYGNYLKDGLGRSLMNCPIQGVFDTSVYSIIDYTIGQYAGLNDKDGNKIFEGDIIKTYSRLVKVVFMYGKFIGINSDGDKYSLYFGDGALKLNNKVVGNIIDNPDLLK